MVWTWSLSDLLLLFFFFLVCVVVLAHSPKMFCLKDLKRAHTTRLLVTLRSPTDHVLLQTVHRR